MQRHWHGFEIAGTPSGQRIYMARASCSDPTNLLLALQIDGVAHAHKLPDGVGGIRWLTASGVPSGNLNKVLFDPLDTTFREGWLAFAYSQPPLVGTDGYFAIALVDHASSTLATGHAHLTVEYDGSTNTLAIYVDASLVASTVLSTVSSGAAGSAGGPGGVQYDWFEVEFRISAATDGYCRVYHNASEVPVVQFDGVTKKTGTPTTADAIWIDDLHGDLDDLLLHLPHLDLASVPLTPVPSNSNTVRGKTSGATATIAGFRRYRDGTGFVVFGTRSGDFTLGEVVEEISGATPTGWEATAVGNSQSGGLGHNCDRPTESVFIGGIPNADVSVSFDTSPVVANHYTNVNDVPGGDQTDKLIVVDPYNVETFTTAEIGFVSEYVRSLSIVVDAAIGVSPDLQAALNVGGTFYGGELPRILRTEPASPLVWYPDWHTWDRNPDTLAAWTTTSVGPITGPGGTGFGVKV